MESTIENQHDDLSVLSPTPLSKQRVQTHKDTPLAMKTRHGRKKGQANPEMESPTIPDPPKTPPSRRHLANETPRRSARKSVRPAMDYDDIMLRSATKEMSKVIEVDEEIVEQPTQKWTAAEVGRNSRKRSRKSKRTASKSKTDLGEKEAEVQEPSSAIDVDKTIIETIHEDTSTEKKDSKPGSDDEDEQCLVSVGVEHITADETDEEAMVSTKQAIPMDVNDLGLFPLADTDGKEEIKLVSTEEEAQGAQNKTLDDLGLCPLEPIKQSDRATSVDDFECDMPSLIMLDDDELAEPDKSVLNTTFDAEERKSDESNIVTVDITNSVDSEEKKSNQNHASIKVVLTTEDDQNQTLLNIAEVPTNTTKPSPKRSKGYRFPTPYKSKSRKSPKAVEAQAQLGDIKLKKRRSSSASICEDIKSRTVSFRSPIEVAHVHDIDKRWEGLNVSNVTNRRKRSKSMDEFRPKGSQIPQPKFFKGNQVIAPSKVKKRTKLPNFAAIHQKQFSMMENLVDHLDRKAVRAKVLINSALKHEPGAGSSVKKMPSSSALASGDCSRPRALRKIDWCSNPTVAVAKHPENQFQRELPEPRPATLAKATPQSRLPLKSGSNIVPKPAFNLSTNVVKKFTAASTVSKPVNPSGFEDKVAERRQRHMQMFKSRSAPKEKTGEFIRGVRLNRRFELQMQHRRHLEEE